MNFFLITATHHRSAKLASTALPSITRQTDQCFNWILINDGLDSATRELAHKLAEVVTDSKTSFAFTYVEMPHPSPTEGFGLCHARNLGLSIATSQLTGANRALVSYLDDDNELDSDFVACTKQFFHDNSTIQCSMAQQLRHRNVTQDGRVVRQGKPFISPHAQSTTQDLIQQKALFDSNGFTHVLAHVLGNAPTWNPKYRIFADYEYFLQCLCLWGIQCFKLNQRALVNYTQSSDGIIGQSNYQDWIQELQFILEESYPALSSHDRLELLSLIQRWHTKVSQQQPIPAFAN